MAKQIAWSESALDDLEAIADYIADSSISSARKVVTKVRDATHKLEQFPHLGMIVPELGDSTIRQSLILQYRMIYQVEEDRLVILSIIHTRRSSRGRATK
jgi:addiction module RelE/StbE family toxin